MKKLFFLYVLLIVYFSLYAWSFTPSLLPPHGILHGWTSLVGRRDWFDVAVNLLFYVPYGMLGALAWTGAGRLSVLSGGILLSLVMEIVQAWIPGRDSSFQDVLMNSLGTLLGVLVGAALRRHRPGGSRAGLLAVRRPMAAVLAAAWLTGQLFPFLPILNLRPLWQSLARLARIEPVSGLTLAEAFVGYLLLAYVLRAVFDRKLWHASLVAALLALLFKTCTQSGNFSWPLLGTAALAFWISAQGLSHTPLEAKLLAVLAVLALAAGAFAPFSWSGPPAPFHWTPFAGFFGLDHVAAIRIAATKFFLYGATVWMLREAGGTLAISTGAVTLLVAAGEAAQRYLPGRFPESTDPLLALLAGLLMLWLRDGRTPSPRRIR